LLIPKCLRYRLCFCFFFCVFGDFDGVSRVRGRYGDRVEGFVSGLESLIWSLSALSLCLSLSPTSSSLKSALSLVWISGLGGLSRVTRKPSSLICKLYRLNSCARKGSVFSAVAARTKSPYIRYFERRCPCLVAFSRLTSLWLTLSYTYT
jgi:hypothetical protein